MQCVDSKSKIDFGVVVLPLDLFPDIYRNLLVGDYPVVVHLSDALRVNLECLDILAFVLRDVSNQFPIFLWLVKHHHYSHHVVSARPVVLAVCRNDRLSWSYRAVFWFLFWSETFSFYEQAFYPPKNSFLLFIFCGHIIDE